MELEKEKGATTVVKRQGVSFEFAESRKSSLVTTTSSKDDLIQLVNCEAHA